MRLNSMCFLVLGCAAAFAGLQAIAQDQSQPNSGANSQDVTFVQTAAEGGLAEVQLGQLAAQKSTNPQIQAFGQKMVHDHTMLNDKMKPVAESLGVTPPTNLDSKDQAEYDRLNGLSGTEFDQAYLKTMVMDHRMDLRLFRQEEASTTNPQLKKTVAEGEKVITEHLRMVTRLAQQNGVDVPRRGGGPATGQSGQ